MPLYKPLPRKKNLNPLVNRSQIQNGVYQSHNHLPPQLPVLHPNGGRMTQENSQEYDNILQQMDLSKESKFISLQDGEEMQDNSFFNPQQNSVDSIRKTQEYADGPNRNSNKSPTLKKSNKKSSKVSLRKLSPSPSTKNSSKMNSISHKQYEPVKSSKNNQPSNRKSISSQQNVLNKVLHEKENH